jgi:murein DD-endopeptidase MepM/ murein hydrolase activator NlpD
MKPISRTLQILLTVALLLSFAPTPSLALAASSAQDQRPVYIVQSGDTLNSIALRFGVSSVDLANANGITDPNALAVNMRLVIPGLTGISGILTTQAVPFGETLTTISRRTRVPIDLIARLNHLTSPVELYAGVTLVIPQSEEAAGGLNGQLTVAPGQSLVEAAILAGENPWKLTSQNGLAGSWEALPGDRLYFDDGSQAQAGAPLKKSGAILPGIDSIEISPLPLIQGHTAVVKVASSTPVSLSGSLAGRPLQFDHQDDTHQVALQGLHAMAKPGLYPIQVQEKLEDGSTYEFGQMILMQSGNYPQDPPLTVPPETLDPAVTKPEEDLVTGVTASHTPQQLWQGVFERPVDEPFCVKSWFGDRRSYNGSDYTFYHTGLDYGVCANLNIRAAAAGQVVYTGALTVRGNATIIDHGHGVFTGYWHQKEILVKVGDRVEAGQIIGVIGGTGRANGPHLHFEVWVNGVQVEPAEWLVNTYP